MWTPSSVGYGAGIAKFRDRPNPTQRCPDGVASRAIIMLLVWAAIAMVFFTNRLLTNQFTETTRNRAELRLALYSGNLQSELSQSAIVPQLLARDPALIGALNSADYQQSTNA